MKGKHFFSKLTVQVLIAIALGVLVGSFAPDTAQSLKPIGDLFIKTIRMLIAPIVFLTIVIGIAGAGSMKKFGRVGGKALLYFELVTTLALVIGVAVAWWVRPGDGISPDLVKQSIQATKTNGNDTINWLDFVMHIVPLNAVGAFAEGDMLQVLFFSVLFGVALNRLGDTVKPLLQTFDRLIKVFFELLHLVMKLAPLGAFGGMAYTIGKFGIDALLPLAKLMGSVYLTMFFFIFGVLNFIAYLYKFSLWRLLVHIKDELLIVLGTSSSESVLPQIIEKLQQFGCSRSVVGLVIPTGYSFNLDGTSIYLSMAIVFLTQVFNVELNWAQAGMLVAVLMLTSKGAAGVTGSGFLVLTTTLGALKIIPVEGAAILLGVDRFMSEARAITNLIGNCVATVVVAKSEQEFEKKATD